MSLLTNKLDKQNLILVKGCKPGQGVKEDTKLIEDFAFCLKEGFQLDDLSIVFPKIID